MQLEETAAKPESNGGRRPRGGDSDPAHAGRDPRSDYLKAAAIIGVVAIHAALPFADVFRFGVPVFIALWAFYYERGLAHRSGAAVWTRAVWTYATRRFVRLLVPYGFWTALYLAMFHDLSEWKTTPPHTIVGGWFGGYGWPGQYFFIILLQLTWLMPFVRRMAGPRVLWPAVLAGAMLNAVADYWLFSDPIVAGIGDRLFVYWLPYVFLGIAFAAGYPRPIPWLLPIALVLLFTVPCELGKLLQHNDRASVYLLPTVTMGSITLLLALASRAPLAPVGRDFSGRSISHVFLAIGRNSHVIFVGNPLVLAGARRLGYAPGDSLHGLLGKVGLIVVAVVACVAAGWVLRRLKLGILVGG